MIPIVSRLFDFSFILAPAFISSTLALFLYFMNWDPQVLAPIGWLMIVVFIDVAHVWSSLFQTYLNKVQFNKNRTLFFLVPLLCYGIGVLLHGLGSLIFWRCLAYMAVFHFIRQQYGFFRIYQKKQKSKIKYIWIDRISIYSSTVIPLLVWHCRGPQLFNWFVPGDFYFLNIENITPYLVYIAILIQAIYITKEKFILKNPLFNYHNLILLGTLLSWWIGIVVIKTDWAFSITNIITHGIPYFALVFHKNWKEKKNLFWPSYIPLSFALSVPFLFAILEEGLWNGLIWKDQSNIFISWGNYFPAIQSAAILALIVPLLALPQMIHYILDGFIWRQR